jgi:hypothetical protein
MRARHDIPLLRSQLVSNLVKRVLKLQKRRPYDRQFHVAHFSIQDDHLHLIVEATAKTSDDEAKAALRSGVSGFAISFARRLNGLLKRKGKVWADRHHRRDLASPTEVRTTLLYVLQNYKHHGHQTYGDGLVDDYSSAPRFTGWSNPHVWFPHVEDETEPWTETVPRTWLLKTGWIVRGGGRFRTSDVPRSWICTAPVGDGLAASMRARA